MNNRNNNRNTQTLEDLLSMDFKMLISLIPERESTVRNMFILAINKRTNLWYDDLIHMTTEEIRIFFDEHPQYYI